MVTEACPVRRAAVTVALATLLTLGPGESSALHIGSTSTSPPVLGLGSVFFRPAGMSFRPSLGDDSDLVEAGTFFVDAFWAGKGGGARGEKKALSAGQTSALRTQQVLEFRRRYGKALSEADRRSELILCRDGKGELLGCAGIEIDFIGKAADKKAGSRLVRAPLMSNLAVGRKFRRRGIAEDLVRATEDWAVRKWGCDECYLYVERRNVPALRLYRKLGYRQIWQDTNARTVIPNGSGRLESVPTTLVCMKKRLRGLGSVIDRLLPF